MAIRPDFLRPQRRYILVNSTDEVCTLTFHSESWGVPPANEVVTKSSKHPRLKLSYKDPNDGKYIPGTLVAEDIMQNGERICDVERAIQHCLGYNPDTGAYQANYGLKGISVLPDGVTRADVEEVRAEGLERFRKWKIKEAIDTTTAHGLRNEARARVGLPPMPPNREFIRADEALRALREEELEAYRKQFAPTIGGVPVPPVDTKKDILDAVLNSPDMLRDLARALKDAELSEKLEDKGVSKKKARDLAETSRIMDEERAEKEARA